MYSGSPRKTPNHAGFVGLIAIVASFVANAQVPTDSTGPAPAADAPVAAPVVTPVPDPVPAAPTSAAAVAGPVATTTAVVKTRQKAAYWGSALTYGHQATAYTFSQSAEGHYNPTWSHALSIAPQWHFNSQLFVRGRVALAQEFTASDTTRSRNEVELSDITLDIGAIGYTEKFTKIRIGGDLRFAFPTSKASIFATRILGVGPSLNVSRIFDIRSGLALSYAGRYTHRFHRFTTPMYLASPLFACADRTDLDCRILNNGGRRNAHSDLTHGPSISFAPLETVAIAAAYQFSHQWLYKLPDADVSTSSKADVPNRHYSNFDLSVSWQIFKPVGLTFGASTFGGQLSSFGTYEVPFFNRNTTLYLDASFDIEAAVSGLFGEST